MVAGQVSVLSHFLEHVGNNLHTHCHESSSPDSRERSHQVQENHIPCNCTSKTTGHEREGAGEKACSATEDIGEATIKGLERSARDQVRCRQPGRSVGRFEFRADEGICRCSYRAIESSQENIGKNGCIVFRAMHSV